MSRQNELDAALAIANEASRGPKIVDLPTEKVPVKTGAPVVKVDRSGHRVRLRHLDHALEGCISSRGGEERYRLEPGVWTTVSNDVYTLLKEKFYKAQEFESVSWNGDLNNPRREVRKESYEGYVIEFPEESNN